MAEKFSFEAARGIDFAKREKRVIDLDDPTQFGKTSSANRVTAGKGVRGELPRDKNIYNAISAAAKLHGVPLQYAFALAQQESSYNLSAHNAETQADGLFQYIPATAKLMNLQHGKDTRDPVKAANAAMAQFAKAMEEGGIEWAIKHHFAGPDTSGHGPKTRQYLADVQQRANDIQKMLGDSMEVDDEDSDVKAEIVPNRFSFEEAVGNKIPVEPVEEDVEGSEESIIERGKKFVRDQLGPTKDRPRGSIVPKFFREPVGEAGERAWKAIRNRLLTDMGQIAPDSPDYSPRRKIRVNAAGEREFYFDDPYADERRIREQKAEREGEAPPVPGFMANLGNPVELFLNDSLPANATEALFNATDRQRESVMTARKILMQENIVANPDKFPPRAVQAAQAEIDRRAKKRDPGVAEMWDDLKKAASEDPGKFGATLVNAVMADPEMLLAPQGLGLRVIQGTRTVQGANAVSRATKIADRILDAGTTGAAINLAIEGAAAESEGRDLTGTQAGVAAGLGFGLSAPFAMFSRVGKAELSRKLTTDDLDTALREAAREELAAEDIVRSSTIDRTVKHRIEDVTGVKFESDADLKAYIETQRREWRKLFEQRDLNGQYQKALADERINRRTQIMAEREQAAARQAVETAEQQRVAAERDRLAAQAARRERFAKEFDEALRARDQQDIDAARPDAELENRLRDSAKRLDEEEIFTASLEGDIPQVRNAMLRAQRRDAQLRRPRYQRGEVDPRLLIRMGLAGVFGTAAYTLADEGYKTGAGLAGALAALIVPGGGDIRAANLGKRLSQAGVTTVDGDIVSLLVQQGKLKRSVEAPEAMNRDAELINLAKNGSQEAFKELYKEHYSRIARMVDKKIRNISSRIGIDADDIAQEVFVDAFQQLDQFSGNVPFSAYLTSIAKNKIVDAVRDAQSIKGGRDVVTSSMYSAGKDFGESARAGHITEGDVSAIKPEVEAAAADLDTPENIKIREDAEQIITNVVNGMSESHRRAFILRNIEQYSYDEISKITGQPLSTVAEQIRTAEEKVASALAKGFNAKKLPNTGTVAEPIKRGRGRPRKNQSGEIDPRMLQVMGVASLGAAAGMYLNEQNRLLGGAIGAVLAGSIFLKGVSGRTLGQNIAEGVDYTLGVTSTRIMNKSKPLWRKAVEHERVVLRDTHKHLTAVDPFLQMLNELPAESEAVLSRAILTGKPEVVNRLLQAIGDEDLISSWKVVRSTLDSIGDQLVSLRRFKNRTLDYFPRIVKDVDGLVKALGNERGSFVQKALKEADDKALRARGTGLTDLERSLVINKIMKDEARASQQPGFAKQRVVEDITPELQKYYATPTESLHSYIRSAVEDIHRAKFFGEDLQVIKKGDVEYTNVDTSIGALVNRLMNDGSLSPTDAEEVANLLKSRFTSGERSANEIVQSVKNLSYAGLLGNPLSAITQFGDVIIQTYTQGMIPTVDALVRKLTNRKHVSMKEFGLSDYVAEEFASTSRSAKFLRKVFLYSLFKGVDEFGKDIALNASVTNLARLSKTDLGINTLASKYADALMPEEFNQLVKDLRKGEVTDLVRSIAFAELSRSQPISRIELPQAYLDNPNGRLLYQFKTFMLKQIDLARRDGYNEIKAGRVKTGVGNLIKLGIALGVAGTSTDVVKKWMKGQDVKLSASDIPMNMLKTYGLSEYFIDNFFGVSKEEAAKQRRAGDTAARAIKAQPAKTVIGMAIPPYKMFDEIVRGDPKAVRYIPIIGPFLHENIKAEENGKQ